MEPNFPSGFIDIHCHLLPGLDDGPATPEAAEQMGGVACTAGAVAVISTPHASHRYRFDCQKTALACAAMRERMAPALRLFSGCELELSLEALPAGLANPRSYTLNGSRYLLLELMPAGLAPNLDRVFAQLLDRGITPVLAHPERSAHLPGCREKLAGWVERGCLAQLTAGSLTGRQGPRLQAAAVSLLRCRLVHFVASDGHDAIRRPPRLLEAYRAMQRNLSPALAELLFISNPRAVLDDQPIRAWPAF
ncbi:MAG: capsular biosynthesis protein [Acidobacteria bacterium]|nr:capsular biosynthesis protein [Acidobacteriota bacterium]